MLRCLAIVIAAALFATACGTGGTVLRTATPGTFTPARTVTPATIASPPPASASSFGTTPAPATPALPPSPVADTPVAGDTGIAGTVTIGPTCPAQRVDSPCPDRPYETTITIWAGDIQVAQTQSGTDGRFAVELSPGFYRVVGESPGTFPRGTEIAVTVVLGELATASLQYDSGIR